jgi:hypothetical protein
LEKRGVRTLTVCTEVFEKMAELERAALGLPNLQLAIIGHPLMNRDTASLEDAVDSIMPTIDALFGGGRRG